MTRSYLLSYHHHHHQQTGSVSQGYGRHLYLPPHHNLHLVHFHPHRDNKILLVHYDNSHRHLPPHYDIIVCRLSSCIILF